MTLKEQMAAMLNAATDPKKSLNGSSIPNELFMASRVEADRIGLVCDLQQIAKAMRASAVLILGLSMRSCSLTIDYYPAPNQQVIHIGFGDNGKFVTRNEPLTKS